MREFFKNINPFNNLIVENRWLYLIKTLLKFAFIYLTNLLILGVILLTINKVGKVSFGNGGSLGEEGLELVVCYSHLISIGLTLLFVKVVDKKTPASLGLTKKDIYKFAFGVCYALFAVIIVLGVLVIFKQYKFEGLNPNRDYKMVFLSAGAFVVYALAEELLCRGLIENRLKERFNIHVCVLVSFIVFCIPHLIELFEYEFLYSVFAIVNLLLISYIFSLLLDVYENVYVCGGFHTAWNLLFFSIVGSNVNGAESKSSIFYFSAKNSLLNGGKYGIECGAITCIVLIVFCVILSFVLKHIHKDKHSKLLIVPKNYQNKQKTDL